MNTQKKRFNSRSLLAMLFVLVVTSFVKVSPAEPVLMLPRTAFASAADRLAAVRAGGATPGALTPQEARLRLPMQKSKFIVGTGVGVPRKMGPMTEQQDSLRRAILRKQNLKQDNIAYGKESAKQIAKNRLAERIASQAKLARVMVTPGYAALSVAPVLGGLAWKGITADTSGIQAQLEELENARMPAVAESWGEHKRAQAYWDKQAAAEVAAKVAAFNAEQAAAQVPAPGRWESFRSGLSDALTGAGSRFANVRQSVGDWYTRGSEGLRGYLPERLQARVTPGQVGAAAAALTGAALAGTAYGINSYRKAQAEKRRLEQEAAEELDQIDV